MSEEMKPIQAKIVGCDFQPEGYQAGVVVITCTAPSDTEVAPENVVIITQKHYKELLRTKS